MHVLQGKFLERSQSCFYALSVSRLAGFDYLLFIYVSRSVLLYSGNTHWGLFCGGLLHVPHIQSHTWTHVHNAHTWTCARLLWLWTVAVVTVWGGTRALVGGYSQYLYGAINQSESAILYPREKKGRSEHRKQAEKREKRGDVWVCV